MFDTLDIDEGEEVKGEQIESKEIIPTRLFFRQAGIQDFNKGEVTNTMQLISKLNQSEVVSVEKRGEHEFCNIDIHLN